ncbi:DUF1565 domain-containing protein [Paenibacillus thailandensis]|uniref:DUF1565 domain-containing protein n=1 Tax=Paenibacillus thailandensis TaxID=393250 RepID=A0ABW5QUY7_9BACL
MKRTGCITNTSPFNYTAFRFFVAALLVLLLVSAPPAAVRADGESGVYYVAPGGNDNNPGTFEAPWRTIQKAANTLRPGEKVYVRGGVYRELVDINVSGTKDGGSITFENYGTEVPVIDGSSLKPTGAEALVEFSGISDVVLKGFELRGLTTDSKSATPAGIRIHNGADNIQLIGNNVHHIENRSSQGNAHGIHVLGDKPVTGLVIQNNEVHHLMTGSSESVTLSGDIDGFVVSGNTVHDNNNIGIVLAGFYGACTGACTDQARNGIVSENTVYGIDSSSNPAYGEGVHSAGGIYADGATGITIERNDVYGNDFGIELASEKKGKATSRVVVRNNYVHDNLGAGLIMGGADAESGGAANNEIVNNTFVHNDTLRQGYRDITLQWNNRDNRIANNVIFSHSNLPGIIKDNTSGSGNAVDYNLYYNDAGTAADYWEWNGAAYTSWAAYKQGSGNDAHSLFADPLFTTFTAKGLNLSYRSPAVDRGTALPADIAGDTDYAGEARLQGNGIDIGAKETASSALAVDGSAADWKGVPVLNRGAANAKALRAYTTGETLYLLAEGTKMTSKAQFYLNTDNNAKSGFQLSLWKQTGADYLVENGRLYRYEGSGSDWKWASADAAVLYAATETAAEASIPLSALGGAGTNIRVGYVWNDSATDKLPAGNWQTLSEAYVNR